MHEGQTQLPTRNVWGREEVIFSEPNQDAQGRILGDAVGFKMEKTALPDHWNTDPETWTLETAGGLWHTRPCLGQGPLHWPVVWLRNSQGGPSLGISI